MATKKEEKETIIEEQEQIEKISKMSIYEKIQNCRVELQKMNLKKSGENKFAKFKYYELADILPPINEMFLKYNLHSTFNLYGDKAILKIYNLDNIEQIEIFESTIAEADIKGCTPIQSLGGIHTYMKRYLYINALEIVENDMFDAKVGDMEVEPTKMMTEEQKNILNSLNNEDKKRIIAKYGTANLTFKQASEALKEFK